MKVRFWFVFVIFYSTAVLIFAVYLRGTSNRLFYQICRLRIEQNRLQQQLASKQLELENLINPAAVFERLGE